jgi:hypothetical protein
MGDLLSSWWMGDFCEHSGKQLRFMVTRYTVGNIHNFKTALKVLLVGILLGTAAAVSTPFANQEGVVTRLNEKQEYVTTLLPDHTYGIVQKPAHSATTKSQLSEARRIHSSPSPSLAAGLWTSNHKSDPFNSDEYTSEHLQCLHWEYQGINHGCKATKSYAWTSDLPMYAPYQGSTQALQNLVNNRFKRFVLIGDSVTRELFYSLSCLLKHKLGLKGKDKRTRVWGSGDMWTTDLVSYIPIEGKCGPSGRTCSFAERFNEIVNGAADGLPPQLPYVANPETDVVVVNIGHHFSPEITDFKTGKKQWPPEYKDALDTLVAYLSKLFKGHEDQVFFRTTESKFYRVGEYDTHPGRMACEKGVQDLTSPTQNATWTDFQPISRTQPLQNEMLFKALENTKFSLLDTAPMTLSREDTTCDCLHLCMPGPIEAWNQLLFQRLLLLSKKPPVAIA